MPKESFEPPEKDVETLGCKVKPSTNKRFGEMAKALALTKAQLLRALIEFYVDKGGLTLKK